MKEFIQIFLFILKKTNTYFNYYKLLKLILYNLYQQLSACE